MALSHVIPDSTTLTRSRAPRRRPAAESGGHSPKVRVITLINNPEYGVKGRPKKEGLKKEGDKKQEEKVVTFNCKRDQTICFKGEDGVKVRVEFLSPCGGTMSKLHDSETCKLTVGGCYHFKCFFTPIGGKEIENKTGAILDVQPHRP